MIHRMKSVALLMGVTLLFGTGTTFAHSSDPAAGSNTAGAISPAFCPQSPIQPLLVTAKDGTLVSCTPLQGSISASPGSVDYNGSTTVSWSLSPAVYTCNISSSPNVWGSAVGPSGSQGVGPLQSATTFYLHCDATDSITGGDWSATVNVAAPPPPPPSGSPPTVGSFSADSYNLTAGQTTIVHWACSSNTSQVNITSSSPSATGQWLGVAVSGQGSTLSLPQGTFTLTLTCANGYGQAQQSLTLNVGAALPQPPLNTAMPVLSGTVQVGSTLSTSNGGWTNSPTSYSYEWRRCDTSGANCSLIAGAAGQAYKLVLADAGHTIESGVAASNSSGTSPYAWSIPSAVVPVPPQPPLINSFTSNPTGPWSGSSVQLSWTSTGSTACAIASNPLSGGAAGGLPASGIWTTPSLPAGQVQYVLTCNNSMGSTQATLYVGVFDTSEQYAGQSGAGQNTDASISRSLDTVRGCRWKSENNENDIYTHVGLRAGGLTTTVQWCVKNGYILRVVRTISVIGPNYPLSGWKFDGIVSNGPCDEQCANYVSLYGTNRTSINIWVEGHWSLCLSIPVIGSLCAQDAYAYVGVRIRGDGTRDDTYNP
jgi:hypothetical protein